MHYSQLLRIEAGDFKTLSRNVQILCKSLCITNLPGDAAPGSPKALELRFHALLSAVPGSAAAFASLFELLERPATHRRGATGRSKR